MKTGNVIKSIIFVSFLLLVCVLSAYASEYYCKGNTCDVTISNEYAGILYSSLVKSYNVDATRWNLYPNDYAFYIKSSDDTLGTSKSGKNFIMMADNQTKWDILSKDGGESIIDHEYSHIIANTWNQPYGPQKDQKTKKLIDNCAKNTRPCREDEGIGENWANYGSSLIRNSSLFYSLYWFEMNDIVNSYFDFDWNWAFAGSWWDMCDVNNNGIIDSEEESCVRDIIYILKNEKPQNISDFYYKYVDYKNYTAYEGGTTCNQAWQIKNIFHHHGIYDLMPQTCSLYLPVYTGNYYDYMDNGNLIINIELNISVSDIYDLSGHVSAFNSSSSVFSQNIQYLNEGIQNVSLIFDGKSLYNNELQGNLLFEGLDLINSTGVSQHYLENPYNTSNYNISDYSKPDVYLLDILSDELKDTANGIGLRINLSFQSSNSGAYLVSANIYDLNETFVTSASNYFDLSNGTNDVSLDFAGNLIYLSSRNGPYILKDIIVYEENDDYLHSIFFTHNQDYYTYNYSYMNYSQPYINQFTVYSYNGLHLNLTSSYDAMNISFLINSTENSNITITFDLYDNNLNMISQYQTGNEISTGQNIISSIIDSKDLLKYNSSDVTLMNIFATDENGLVTWMESYNLTQYNKSDFGVQKSTILYDATENIFDTDNDTFYDIIRIYVPVLINDSGNYTIIGFLDDALINQYYETSLYLEKGYNIASLDFDTTKIQNDGRYYIKDVTLITNNSSIVQIPVYYVTDQYYTNTFPGPKVEMTGSYDSSALDNNSDLMFEFLNFSFETNTRISDDYSVIGYLYGENNSFIDLSSIDYYYYYLQTGKQNISLLFIGKNIKKSKLNGPYYLNTIEIYDSNNSLVLRENVNFASQAYNFSQFENTFSGYNMSDLTFTNFTIQKSAVTNATLILSNLDFGDAFNVRISLFNESELMSQRIIPYVSSMQNTAIIFLNISIGTSGTLNAFADIYNEIRESNESNNNYLLEYCETGQNRTCGSDVGACSYGNQQCESSIWGECTGATGPTEETCDNIDDDCDGIIDNITMSCGPEGYKLCQNGVWSNCSLQGIIQITNVTELFSSGNEIIYEFIVWNNESYNSSLSNLVLTIDTGLDNISFEAINLSVNETTHYIFDYKYSKEGDYVMTIFVTDGLYYSSKSVNITILSPLIMNVSVVYQDNSLVVCEAAIQNDAGWDINISNTILTVNTGVENISFNSINISEAETVLYYFEYKYNNVGSYAIIINSSNITYSIQKSINITVLPPINIQNFSVIYQNETYLVYEFYLQNRQDWQTNLTDINWTLHTGEDTIYSDFLTNLIPNETAFYIVEYNYSEVGQHEVNLTVWNEDYSDIKVITVNN